MTMTESPNQPVADPEDEGYQDTLTWEDSYAIAQALRLGHSDIPLAEISLGMIYRWTLALPGFDDDPQLANEAILSSIYQEWFEEVNPL
ncbi:MAG TPA: Fe-S cluster assembly protein IscX [Anaerolineales bacterium]